MNSTSGLTTGPSACADYAAFNRATFYASPANGPTIVNGTFLYTNSSLTTPIPDGYYSDGTTYWFFQNGSTGDNGTLCNTTTTTSTSTTSTTTAAPTTTTSTTTLAFQSYDLYFPCGSTTPADLRVAYTGNQSPGEIILASNGLCYTIVGPTIVGPPQLTIVSEHSTCEDCEAARPTTTTTSTSTTTAAPTTTTTAGPTSTSTTTAAPPPYYYYALSTCWGEPSSIEIGRSTSSSYGTAVFLISGICHQSNGITSGPSYDVDLDTQTIVPAGCSDASCNPPTTTTQAPTTTTTTATPYSGLILCGESSVDYYYTGTISSGGHLFSGGGNCYVSTGTITDLSGKTEIFGTINGCTCP